ncbi:uncharacterized protein LOC135113188 [Scylla paramamosain]|uniref:uncharacterized protein LOC135113188 n=1 Tax=Scylla paramamosain TaxID=85552 RepID=UPI003082A72D
MERDHFDTDLFINEIEKRPSIWDMKSPHYKDRVMKKKHWEEVADIFCPDGEIKEKQNVVMMASEVSAPVGPRTHAVLAIGCCCIGGGEQSTARSSRCRHVRQSRSRAGGGNR